MVKRRRRREFARRPIYGTTNRPNSLLKIFFMVVAVVLLAAGGYYGYPYIINWVSDDSSQTEGDDSLSVKDVTAGNEEVTPSEEILVADKKEPPPAPVEPVKKYQVEVLNGTGIKGLAQKLTDSLRAHGFDVVKTSNFESRDVSESFVINRSGKGEAAKRVAELLGIKKIVPQTTPDLMLDVTVVLGHDFRKLTIFQR